MNTKEIDQLGAMVTVDPGLSKVFARARRVARSDQSVLILGETGAGKEGIAQAIHDMSGRARKPLEPINCAVLSGDLAASELFGHERGAFTGAERRRIGAFERAKGGTVFLDEVGELVPRVQGQLLRLLETRQVRRLGGEGPVACDFRLVSATHRNLATEVAEGRFRRDLFYRVGVIVLVVPPLRARPDDIELLATRMLQDAAPHLRWSRAAMRALRAQPFPGNVRQLRNLVGRVSVLAEGPLVGPEDLAEDVATLAAMTGAGPDGRGARILPMRRPRGRSLDQIRVAAIQDELERQQGNVTRAARVLGVARSTIYSVLEAPADASAGAAAEAVAG